MKYSIEGIAPLSHWYMNLTLSMSHQRSTSFKEILN